MGEEPVKFIVRGRGGRKNKLERGGSKNSLCEDGETVKVYFVRLGGGGKNLLCEGGGKHLKFIV